MAPSSQSPRAIKIQWKQLGITVTAEMNDKNPTLIDLLFKKLPYRSLQDHALVSGDHLYHLVPCEELIYTHPDYKVPNRAAEPDGTVFLSGFQHMAIKYGRLTEKLPAGPCGRVIPEDVPKLKEVGERLWTVTNHGLMPIEAVVWDAAQPQPTGHVPLALQRTGVTPEVQDLVKEIHDKTEESWSSLSPDLEKIHHGLSESRAGSKDSYFSTMLFTNSEVRTLGYYTLNNILKIAATQPHFDLRHLITLYRTLITTSAEFMGYLGADFLCSAHRRIDALISKHVEKRIDTTEAREDFLAMVSAYAQYANLLNAQDLVLFPWRFNQEYPIPSTAASERRSARL